FDAGMHYQVDHDRDGRVLFSTSTMGGGEIAIKDVNGKPDDALKEQMWWRADYALMEFPVRWGYRHNSRFYVGCGNESKPGNERWIFDRARGRLLGYDARYHQQIGSFGPDGFAPTGQPAPERFRGELRYLTNRWQYIDSDYLVFPGAMYRVDFARRTIH